METVKGTQTEKNLLKAFAWESQARMKYDYFAKKAKKEWYEQISGIFLETAENEKQHAKIFLNFLEWWPVNVTAQYSTEKVQDTLNNLKNSAEWENEEWEILYPQFIETARQEWFESVAFAFQMVSEVEKNHEKIFRKLYRDLKEENFFDREEVVIWKCRKCGYTQKWKVAPKVCPTCNHPQGYFQVNKCEY